MAHIYKIADNTTKKVYIGKTIKPIKARLCEHVSDYKRNRYCSSHHIIKNGDYKIELIEEVSKECSKNRERFWIENYVSYNPDAIVVNKVIPGRRRKEWLKIYDYNSKKYYNNNKDKISIHKKKYYEFKKSWGGDVYKNNNLLRIDSDLFITEKFTEEPC